MTGFAERRARPGGGRHRSAARRVWNAGARLPALADRPGYRWLLSGRVVGAPIVILVHKGRRSGRVYRTPVEAIVEDGERGEVVISPMRGKRGDWYRNVLAGELVEARLRGESLGAEWRELSEAERRAALGRYVGHHPVYGRLVLRALARLNGLEGPPLEAVGRAIPMLALRRAGDAQRVGG